MATIAKLLVALGIDANDFQQGLDQSTKQTEKWSLSLGGIGAIAAAGVATAGAALIGLGIAGESAFEGFQQGITEVFTLLPNASDSAMAAMTQDVKDFSMEFGVLPEKTIPALYEAISSGIPSDNVFTFLETAQKAARAGVTELATTVDGLTSVINAYGAETISASEASDQMFVAVKIGKTTFGELSSSLYNVLPVAASLGVEFGDVTSAIAAMTAQGVPTAQTTTQLRQLFVELSDTGGDLGKMFKQLAGSSFKDFIAKGGNVQEALQILEKSAKGSNKGLNELFGSVEAGSAALALTGKGTALFGQALDETAHAAGATDKAYDKMNTTLAASRDKIKAAGAVFLTTIGEKMAPSVSKLADAFVKVVQSKEAMRVVEGFGIALAKTFDLVVTFGKGLLNLGKVARGWGQNIGGSFAAGIMDSAKQVVSALKSLGSIIAGWLRPGSPPKILPDLDTWGKLAGQEWLDGIGNADDLSGIQKLADIVKSGLDSLASAGQFSKEGIIPAVIGSQKAIADAVKEFSTVGTVAQETFDKIANAAGPMGVKVVGVARAYFDLRSATDRLTTAQQGLTDVTRKYDAILAPLTAKQKELQDQEQAIRDMQRVQELQKILHDKKTSQVEKELAQNELEQIAVARQIAGVESQRDAEIAAAQAKVTAATEEQTAAQKNYDMQTATMEASNKQNELVGAQIALLQSLAEKEKGAGGGAGDLAAGLGGAALGLGDLNAQIPTATGLMGDNAVATSTAAQNYRDLKDRQIEALDSTSAIGVKAEESSGMFSTAMAKFQPAIDSTITRFTILGEIVQGVFADIENTVNTYGEQIRATATKAFDQLVKGINNVIVGINDVVNTVFSQLLVFFQVNGQDISNTVAQAWILIMKIVGDAAEIIGKIVLFLTKDISTYIEAHGKNIQLMLNNAWLIVKNIILGALELISGTLATVLQAMNGDWSGAWETFKQTCATFVLRLWNIIKGFLELVAGFFGTTLAGIEKLWIGNWEKLKAALIAGVAANLKVSKQFVDDFLQQFVDAWNALTKTWNDIKKVVTDAVNAIKQFISEKVSEIKNSAENIGKGIIDGIKNGIKNGWSALENYVRNLARDLLQSAKDALGISSPSKEFAEIGENVVLGFQQGLDNLTPTFLGTMYQALQDIIGESEELTDELLKKLGDQVMNFAKAVASATVGFARGTLQTFRDLRKLETVGDNKAVVDSMKALNDEQKRAIENGKRLNQVRMELDVLARQAPSTDLDEITKQNERVTALYAEQNKLLGEQVNINKNIFDLNNAKVAAETEAAQQQQAVQQIAQNAAKAYEALERQVQALMVTDPKKALELYNRERQQIQELAELEKERALTTNPDDRRALDTQIRLLKLAQSAEDQAASVTEINIGPINAANSNMTEAQWAQFIGQLINQALRAAGVSTDTRYRTT